MQADTPCPFCAIAPDKLCYSGRFLIGIWDRFPVAEGHALVIPRRHFADWFDATADEHAELQAALRETRVIIAGRYHPNGYNIGINVGAEAGQTVLHAHIHLIPRYTGDVPDPRGGVRHVIAGKANYLADFDEPGEASGSIRRVPHDRPLIGGGSADPLLPHLIAYLDRADKVDIAVAFTLESGVRLLEYHLQDILDRGGRVRLLTGDYLGVTDPDALMRLLDLRGAIHLKVFESGNQSFHPKAYIIRERGGRGIAFIGSSNLSETALNVGVEWNYRVITSRDADGFAAVVTAFDDLFSHPNARPLDISWIDAYLERRIQAPPEYTGIAIEQPPDLPEAHSIQLKALAALEQTRRDGNAAGLVVLATGLGKTWLSAFDCNRPEFKRVLFVAHRDEILDQALRTFRDIQSGANLGRYTGTEKAPDADVLFASIQTLGRQRHLERFERDRFDYVIVDEFHHASAHTYRRLIEHFQPKFLLGLTATPERSDGGDLLALCGENLVYRCDLADGIRQGLLSPFDYYGVPDPVQYENIPWRSNRFDEEALTQAVATQDRAQNALEQHQLRGGTHTIAFCVSLRHADYMAEFFRAAGLRAAAVHSGERSDPRTLSLEQLRAGELDVLFAVDMFNEGVDIPDVDTILMLRPTESKILWLQQFGRGLRQKDGKKLKVIDYIGNHRMFLIKPRTLLQLGPGDGELRLALERLQDQTLELPPGCSVTYDLEAKDILLQLLRLDRGDALRAYYNDFLEQNDVRPLAVEAYHDGYNPGSARPTYGSWLRFVKVMEGLSVDELKVLEQFSGLLDSIEVTRMTKSFKMLVLLAMLAEDCFPGQIAIDRLTIAFGRIAERSARLRDDVGPALKDPAKLRKLIETNPIAAWTGGQGTGGVSYFAYDDESFRTTFNVDSTLREPFQDVTRELADWHLAAYLQRGGADDGSGKFVCRVSQSSGTPILFLPDRARHANIPQGRHDVSIDGQIHQANFVKVAVNVVRQGSSERNLLPDILRRWFGPDAGQPGTSHQVTFTQGDKGPLQMSPSQADQLSQGPELWQRYKREQLPGLFGLEFNEGIWRSGFISVPGQIFLLVTLRKGSMQEKHRYEDKFDSPELFQWQSQNRTTQASKHGQLISRHRELGVTVHLFVRQSKLLDQKAAPFIYCGELDFQRWEGEKPITVWWKLRTPRRSG